jgi:hypothetical protein
MPTSHEFFEMIGGAAATLMGLLFVAVSLNMDIILGATHQHAKHLAEQAFQSYLGVLIVSLLVLFPGITNGEFGSLILVMSALYMSWIAFRLFRTMRAPRTDRSPVPAMRRHILSFLGFGLLVYAGAQILSDQGDPRLVPVAVLLLLVSATSVSWELLIKVAADKYAGRNK